MAFSGNWSFAFFGHEVNKNVIEVSAVESLDTAVGQPAKKKEKIY